MTILERQITPMEKKTADLKRRIDVLEAEKTQRVEDRKRLVKVVRFLLLGIALVATVAVAAPSSKMPCADNSDLFCFTPNTPASANEVNHNFQKVKSWMEQKVGTLGTGDIVASGRIQDVTGYVAPVGTITAFAGAAAPTGWLLCDGAQVSKATYANLFSVTGTAFGDAGSNFHLPDLNGRVPVGLDSGQVEFDVRGEAGGETTHALTVAQMPSHAHSYVDPNTGGFKGLAYDGTGSTAEYSSEGAAGWTSLAGSSEAHNNLQPYLAMNYIIKY